MTMSTTTYEDLVLEGSDVLWYCPDERCTKPNFSWKPFNPPIVTSDDNRYSLLAEEYRHSSSSSFPDPGSIQTPASARARRITSTSSTQSLNTPSSMGDPEATSTPVSSQAPPTAVCTIPKSHPNPLQRKIVLMNCQSVVNKTTELQTMLSSTEADIVIATESWLRPDILNPEIFPSNYNVYRKDRPDTGGGVFILVSNKLISSSLDDYASAHEAIWVEIKEQKGPSITVGAFYRPPKDNLESLESFGSVINNVTRSTSGTLIIGGDFNLPGVDWTNNTCKPHAASPALCNTLIDIAQDNGLEQIVDEPTRGDNILDLLFTNNPTLINNAQCMPPLSQQADHNTVFIDMNIKPKVNKQPPRKVHQYKKADWQNIKGEVTKLSDSILADKSHTTTQKMWDQTEKGLQKIINDHIPSKTIKGYKNPPWFTNDLKQLFRKRNAAYRRWLKTKSHQDEMLFHDLKAEAQKMWRQAKDGYTNNIFDPQDDDYEPCKRQPLKKFWGFIKSLKKDSSGTAPLKEDGVLISDAKGKADILNRQYASVFTEEDISTVPDLGPSPFPKMPHPTVTQKGVEKLLSGLNPNKAAGPDKLSPIFLKEVSEELAPLYTQLFQRSLDEGTVPKQWRTADVSPIFKKGEKYDPANYRPVSLTAVTSKCLEHIIAKSIMSHLEDNGLLTNSQHGFRANRSCETQIMNFTQELTKGMAEGQQFDVNVMDFSKAFDRVPHHRLLRKAEHYGIEGPVHSWLRSFLDHRTQRVIVDGEASSTCDVISGVPQGTVLGPVLFLLFINDLPSTINSPCKLFADDLVVYHTIKDQDDITALQQDMDHLSEWELKWGMKFHPDKCEQITITRKRKPIESSYTLQGHTLKKVDQAKYLGVTISANLDWKGHINKSVNKANRTLGFLKRNLKSAPEDVKETAYKSLVRPQVEYCGTVWDPYTAELTRKVEMVQRRAARFVLRRYHYMSSVGGMISQLGWESLEARRAKMRMVLLYKATHNLIAVDSHLYLIPITMPTRQSHRVTYRQISTRTNYHKFSFYPRSIPQWNSLPASIAESPQLEEFKTGLAGYTIPVTHM